MKIVKKLYRSWAMWSSTALAVALALQASIGELEGVLPDGVFSWAVVALAVATPILRSIVQRNPPERTTT